MRFGNPRPNTFFAGEHPNLLERASVPSYHRIWGPECRQIVSLIFSATVPDWNSWPFPSKVGFEDEPFQGYDYELCKGYDVPTSWKFPGGGGQGKRE